ncbi:RNA polymerase sigma factor [Rossellomorea marisflavi]|uniref:RNA polymerase sigma factor n=1 Tax=Rossellomorea marisflavi TaxID=189381 RepID=UPI00207A5EF3|nr:RNA polymerase sigma factor [Rossellomorea marisflavi]USK93445.1 RNA polymerase sigma factor [Rossellomorea marisflavi]
MNADLESLGSPLRDLEREFKEKIEPYRSDLWRYCRTLTRSPWDAEDLVQDTLLRAFSLLPKLYQPIEPKAYLFKIATNRWIDQRRKQERIEMREDMEEINAAGEFDYQLLENLEHLVHILTPVQYVSIILTDAFLYKGKEVAHIIGTTEASVHAHVSRARKSLRKYNPVSNAKSGTSASVDSLQADPVIATMLEGFRSKDPERIASVLHEEIQTEIVHSGLEIGLEETKRHSLEDWHQIVQDQQTIIGEYRLLWGAPVIVELEEKEDGKRYLNNLHRIEMEEGLIISWRFYCFSWDLMKQAAEELDVELNAAYFYHLY